MSHSTLVEYYTDNEFNPVPINLQTEAEWQTHLSKRQNLYENHLRIPLGLLQGVSVLEFGCNSGENALVLAFYGAKLVLVEPNPQVLPRLVALFQQYQLHPHIQALLPLGVMDFQGGNGFPLVIAEGFLYTLENRGQALRKIVSHVAPNGLGIISFNDTYGSLMEITKRALLRRVCELAGVSDIHSDESLRLADQLFGNDFRRLNASRPFAAWWKDTLVNPFLDFQYLWTYQEIMPIIEAENGQLHSVSPMWDTSENFNWYKNIQSSQERQQAWVAQWYQVFAYILTGIKPSYRHAATPAIVNSAYEFVKKLSQVHNQSIDIAKVEFPRELSDYLAAAPDQRVQQFAQDYQQLLLAMHGNDLDKLLQTYHGLEDLKSIWGTTYHYLCFKKLSR